MASNFDDKSLRENIINEIKTIDNKNKVLQLIALLLKICSFARHCNLTIDWKGDKFRWALNQFGTEADDYNPKEQFKLDDYGIHKNNKSNFA